MTVIPRLTTARLRLRPFDMTDADRVHELLAVPDIADTTLNIPYPYPEGAAAAWITGHAQAAREGTSWTWAITRHQDDLLLGAIGMGVVMAHRRGTLGYWLGVPFWGQGYTSEAVRHAVAFGFEDLGLHRIDAECMSRNPASAKVMQRAGMVHEGTFRDYIIKNDSFESIDRYAVIRDAAP
ncbi:MAG TPA: GNAT family N-acetyltransferase [Thermomicrobiales bacterium]|nr:GNAT family N-acetyltransferase [Thermomicrobiales bacterium]